MKHWGAFLAAWASWAMPVMAQEAEAVPTPANPAPDAREGEDATVALVDIRDNLMQVQSGFGGFSLRRGGRPLDLGLFGANVDSIFHGFPEALEAAQAYRGQNTAGIVLASVGLATLAADIVLIAVLAAQGNEVIDANRGLVVGLLVGGGVTTIAGSYLLATAQGNLLEAVNRYNTSLFNRHLPPEKRVDLKVFLSGNAPGLGFRYRF